MNNIILRVNKLLTPKKVFEKRSIEIEEGKIKKISSWGDVSSKKETLDFPDSIAVPGFIDIHTHGYGGHDVNSGKKKDLIKISESLPKHGVTSFIPTALSESPENLLNACRAFREAKKENYEGAEMLGIHLEGPHFGTGREKGAQNPKFLREPNVEELKKLNEASGGNIRRVTLGPELPGALEYIQTARELGIKVSAGHTHATYEEAIKGFDAGVTICIHLYNGMRRFHHREPGIIGACLTRDDVYAEMVADMIHLHPVAIQIAVGVKGLERCILITDSISVTGLPDGEYELGGQKTIVEDGTSRIKKTGRLAGSTLTMDEAVKNVIRELDFELKDVISMASLNPAEALGLSGRGKLAPDYLGNITILNSQLDVVATFIKGKLFYQKKQNPFKIWN